MTFRTALRGLSIMVGATLILMATPSQASEAGPPRTALGPGAALDATRGRIDPGLAAELRSLSATDPIRVIVRTTAPVRAAELARLTATVGQFHVERVLHVVTAFAAILSAGQLTRLARAPVVARIEPDFRVYASADAPDDSGNSAQDSFGVTRARIDANVSGDGDGDPSRYTSHDMVAAVLDTGIDASHLDLDGGKVLAFHDLVGQHETPYDDNGHGTKVAGILAGDGNARPDRRYEGVAPGAALVGVKVLSSFGSGDESTVIAGIDWVLANKDTYGIRAMNLSMSSWGCSNGSDALSTAVDTAVEQGLVTVVAAGNNGPASCTIGSPAAAPAVLTVGAMADEGVGGFYQARFSSRGPTDDGRVKPDISAPGVDIPSDVAGTTDRYVLDSGTSVAAPFVTGVALLMLARNPALTPSQVKALIMGTAVDWARGGDNVLAASSGPDDDYGAGRLDAYAAISQASAPPLMAPPSVPGHAYFEGALSGTGANQEFAVPVRSPDFPIAATLIDPDYWPATPSIGLQLRTPDGAQVASCTLENRQCEFSFTPTFSGAFRLRVDSARGAGAFLLDVSGDVELRPPSPPAGVSVTAANRSMTVRFSPPPDDGGAKVDIYEVTAVPLGGGPAVSRRVAGGPVQFLGLTNNRTYEVTVAAHSAVGWGPVSQPLRAHPRLPVGDYNGDGRTDLAVWRPSNGTWYIKGMPTTTLGAKGDVPVPGDYNGDGRTDLAVWRPSNGTWYIKGMPTTTLGAKGDVPVPGDYNGDGRTDLAVWRPSNGTWYIKGIATTKWGASGDVPVPGDYNGDGRTDLAVWRPSNGTWYIKGMPTTTLGAKGDVPVPGDYNGDGRTDLAVWRPSNGTWYIKGIATTTLGAKGDVPVPGDYNGDGRTDLAVWRPSNGTWYIKGIATTKWGASGDVPVAR